MKKVQYEKIMLDDQPELRQQLMAQTGAQTVPITTDGETFVVGWNVMQLNNLISKVVA